MAKPTQPSADNLIAAQTGANLNAAQLGQAVNNVNEYNPLGSVTYGQDGYQTIYGPNGEEIQIPRTTRTVTLDPAQQALLDQQTNLARSVNDYAGESLNWLRNQGQFTASGLPAGASPVSAGPVAQFNPGDLPDLWTPDNRDYSADRDLVTNTLIDRMQPYWDRDEGSTRQMLANQGLTPGSEAYTRELNDLSRRRDDARLGAILAGGQEQSRLVGLDLARGQAQNAARGQAYGERRDEFATNLAARGQQFGEQLSAAQMAEQVRNARFGEAVTQRQMPLNEIAAFNGIGQPMMPQFSGPFQQGTNAVPAAEYIWNQYQTEMDQYNARMQGIFGLGSTLVQGIFGLGRRPTAAP